MVAQVNDHVRAIVEEGLGPPVEMIERDTWTYLCVGDNGNAAR
jgi:hypothetical protein